MVFTDSCPLKFGWGPLLEWWPIHFRGHCEYFLFHAFNMRHMTREWRRIFTGSLERPEDEEEATRRKARETPWCFSLWFWFSPARSWPSNMASTATKWVNSSVEPRPGKNGNVTWGQHRGHTRREVGNHLAYEVRWAGLDDPKQNTVEPISKLKARNRHVITVLVDGCWLLGVLLTEAMGLDKVIIACDERIAAKETKNSLNDVFSTFFI